MNGKTIFITITLASVLSATVFAGAEETNVLKNGGLQLTIPEDIRELIVTETPEDSEDHVLFSANEKKSVEVAEARGEDPSGAGFLFDIARLSEDEFHKDLCQYMTGEDVFAVDEGHNYYVMFHPTDVRVLRENQEDYQHLEDWKKVCNWAYDTMITDFINENEGLEAVHYDNSDVAMYLARAAFMEDADYTISSLEFGPLEPAGVDGVPYFETLVKNTEIDYVNDESIHPEGEYIVLNFPEDEVRFDFFIGDEYKNYVREVTTFSESLYEFQFTDDSVKASDVMNEWYHEIAAANEKTSAEDISGQSAELRLEDGIFTISIPDNGNKDNGFWWEAYTGDKGDASLVDLLTQTTDEEGYAYIGSFKAIEGNGDGEDYVRLVYTNGKYVDQYDDYNLVVENGTIVENNGGMHCYPTPASDLATVLEGTWEEIQYQTTLMEISLSDDNGLNIVISDGSGKDGTASYYTMTAYYDAIKEALVYFNGTSHTAAVTDNESDTAETEEEGTESGRIIIGTSVEAESPDDTVPELIWIKDAAPDDSDQLHFAKM